ncbi:MAG: hypothetical protein JXQ71_08065 [Verrucomicrobia bacterium]|nr:hypothetical protein [Verrucomicrobiota bacterium]
MSPEEVEILELLGRFRGNYVSVVEISRNVGQRRRFMEDRFWCRPILRRMEMDGLVEVNEFGEYRVMRREENTTSFWQALDQPDMRLGETTIIDLDEAGDTRHEISS